MTSNSKLIEETDREVGVLSDTYLRTRRGLTSADQVRLFSVVARMRDALRKAARYKHHIVRYEYRDVSPDYRVNSADGAIEVWIGQQWGGLAYTREHALQIARDLRKDDRFRNVRAVAIYRKRKF